MDRDNGAGKQLDSKTLYERQKQFRETANIPTGPAIVAIDLRVPENLGMVLRLADAAGASRVVFVNEEEPLQARIRKTARNADTFVPWEICDAETFLQKHAASLQPLIAIELTTTSTNLFETELPEYCALVVGSEQHGIPAEILRMCERAVHIPMYGVNGSMNVPFIERHARVGGGGVCVEEKKGTPSYCGLTSSPSNHLPASAVNTRAIAS